jgi:hypothetical protein
MHTRPSSRRVIPVNDDPALEPDPEPPVEVQEVIQEVGNGLLEAAEVIRHEDVVVEAQEDVSEVIQMDANAYMGLTIGQATKDRYKQILLRFALMLQAEGRAGMEAFTVADITAHPVDILPLENITWDVKRVHFEWN